MGEIYSEILARHGVAVAPAEVRRLFPVVWKELDCRTPPGRDRFTAFPGGSRGFWGRLVERLCELLEVAPPGPFAAAELYHRFGRGEAWEVYADTVPALDRLRALGLRLAVISNFDERLPDLLASLDLERRVDLVVPSAALGVAKPNPAIFRNTLELLGVAASEALHVGDHRLEDVEGAQAAGMEAVLLERGARERGAVESSVSDLLALAERLAGR
jgi:putative hydrolase of the HAD superfamily